MRVTPTPYQAYLRETGPGFGVAFTQLIQTRQPWERALENLDAFLASGGLQADPGKATPKAKRLVWFVDPETQHVEVAEQTPKGKGSWTDGRPVAMKRLYQRDPQLNYLTEQDRTALRSIRREAVGWYGDEIYSFDTSRTIPALVGHPAVFDARQRSRPLGCTLPAGTGRHRGARWLPHRALAYRGCTRRVHRSRDADALSRGRVPRSGCWRCRRSWAGMG